MVEDVRSEEENTLNRCLSRINEIIAGDRRWLSMSKTESALFGEAARDMRQTKEQNIRNHEEARQSPYFGRINFVCAETPNKTETYYFGKYHISLDYVFNWQAPIGRLFYQPLGGKYDSPSGKITGTVRVKRELLIEDARLLRITEYPLLPSGLESTAVAEAPLTRELSKPKVGGLGEIVATIQPEQYEEIAATPQRVMIIQGVAGSGKSDVGLHRIAYLLSPYNELDLAISPSRVVFFGPSKVFLKYVSNLLPGLGVGRVKQTTIREWLRGTLSARIRLEQKDSLLEKLLKGTKKNLAIEVKVAKLKVSLDMAHILERHIQAMHVRFIKNATSIVKGRDVIISEAIVRRLIRRARNQPLNDQRKQAFSQIEHELQRGVLTKLDDRLRADVQAQFDKFWPELDYREVYLDLLSDTNELLTTSSGAITLETAKTFAGLTSARRKVFATEDLPALCYLESVEKSLLKQ